MSITRMFYKKDFDLPMKHYSAVKDMLECGQWLVESCLLGWI